MYGGGKKEKKRRKTKSGVGLSLSLANKLHAFSQSGSAAEDVLVETAMACVILFFSALLYRPTKHFTL